jgi:hypothetical protein
MDMLFVSGEACCPGLNVILEGTYSRCPGSNVLFEVKAEALINKKLQLLLASYLLASGSIAMYYLLQ